MKKRILKKLSKFVAAMTQEFDREGSPYSILSNGKIAGSKGFAANFTFGTGQEQLSVAMEFLARLTMEECCSMEDLLFTESPIPSGTGCLYCCFNYNEDKLQIGHFLRKKNIPLYFLIAKPSLGKKSDKIPLIFLDEIYYVK